ncbi:hypothetical protein Trydic_g8523 [Trypoxylus dichotomus]
MEMLHCHQHKFTNDTRLSKMAAKSLKMTIDSEVHSVLARGRRLSLRIIAHEVNMSKDAVYRIVAKELSTRKICAKLALNNLKLASPLAKNF